MITNSQVKALAMEFCKQLGEYLTPDQIKAVNKRNWEYEQNMCALHEFCDPNFIMDSAFKVTFRREAQLNPEAKTYHDDMDVFNTAWTYAKLNGYSLGSQQANSLLKLCERAFNEIPNKKLAGGKSTYDLAALIGNHLKGSEHV
jgi:hypothetical protein